MFWTLEKKPEHQRKKNKTKHTHTCCHVAIYDLHDGHTVAHNSEMEVVHVFLFLIFFILLCHATLSFWFSCISFLFFLYILALFII